MDCPKALSTFPIRKSNPTMEAVKLVPITSSKNGCSSRSGDMILDKATSANSNVMPEAQPVNSDDQIAPSPTLAQNGNTRIRPRFLPKIIKVIRKRHKATSIKYVETETEITASCT